MMGGLVDRYDERIAGVLSCYDRVVITGTLPTVCYADEMTRFPYANHVRIFDYAKFAEPLRDRVREQAASLAAEAGIAIEHIAKRHIRKEAVVAQVLVRRGEHVGLVRVISAMEACDTYRPWYGKRTDQAYVRADSGKCLHYYFYFMDAELGLIYLRVRTWAPFRPAVSSFEPYRTPWTPAVRASRSVRAGRRPGRPITLNDSGCSRSGAPSATATTVRSPCL